MNELSKLFVVGIFALLLGGLMTYALKPTEQIGFTQEELDSKIAEAKADEVQNQNNQIIELKKEISELKNTTSNKTTGETGEGKATINLLGYTLDELFLEVSFNDEFSDREISLFDGNVDFDGDDYDAEEVFTINGIELKANEKDFEGNAYLTIPEGSISYKFVFESSLNTSEITDDETLVFNLLGNEVEIFLWEDGEITFLQGEEYELVERGGIDVDGKVVALDWVGDNEVYITVDDVGASLDEGETKKINGLEIKVLDVRYTEKVGRESQATLIIGDEVNFEVEDGDEYAEDSIWEWRITPNSIGLILVEEFTELDEKFSVLIPGESICLPNNYVCIGYRGVVDEDSEEYTFELDTKNNLEYVKAKGNFLSGINDYERIYINSSGIYDKDLELIDETMIELGDTESILNISSGWLVIGDFKVNFGLDNVTSNNISLNNKEEDFLTNYGILIESPEDSVDDNFFDIIVPEERLEGILVIRDTDTIVLEEE